MDRTPIRYESSKHQHYILSWLKQWNLSEDKINILSSTGFIIPDVCCIFLYETNSIIAYLDFFMSNKFISDEIRNTCLDKVVYAAILEAKAKGYQRLVGNSKYNAVVDRANRLGFNVIDGNYISFFRSL